MAVQIINFMPDSEVHRGDPELLRAPERPNGANSLRSRFTGRAGFAFATITLHVIALVAFMNAQHHQRVVAEADPIMASLLDAPAPLAEVPPEYTPPPVHVALTVPAPHDVSFETESITVEVSNTVTASTTSQVAEPPVVESVEYVRAPAPVYPSESNRRRERGTVVLRVVVDTLGRPAQIQIEHSSGYVRLDSAAREAVEKALFRPYEVNGVAQPAQVLIPIEFTRRAT